MPQKDVDQRILALMRNGQQTGHRSFFVVVGDNKEAIVHLHYIMTQQNLAHNKSVLWAYKHKLMGFSSNRGKREKKIKKEIRRGQREVNQQDAFELFVSLQDIRYVFYKETDKILGRTFGICILQDFEAITPNTLARTVETVEGGGMVILLLKGMNSLKQLYTLSMDVHSRYRTEAHTDVVARFNERFLLSLGSCGSCLVVDDELNVLPISGGKDVKPLPPPNPDKEEAKSSAQKELEETKESLRDTQPVGPLVQLAKTHDQAKALLTFVDAITEKTLQNTTVLTAARGRGKSAALGLGVCAAVASGYANIFVTSPSPENLRTFFEFVFKGFDALGYEDHRDYSIIQSIELHKAIVRVNIFRSHRQTIQYVRPEDAHVLGQAELVVIDEAAAIPLNLVKKLMGPYLVFMSSTISGYEGTGRSLSLKLIKQLREQSRGGATSNGTEKLDHANGNPLKERSLVSHGGRTLREIALSESIRYAEGDEVEQWLNRLLCLDATLPVSKINIQGCPDPAQCELIRVNRDTLFSFHPVSERFLHQLVSLFVSSHYKNSPDDLQLLSDAPAHELFVLTPPITEGNRLPEPLCVMQICLEGRISRQSVLDSLSRGRRAQGDLIPWLVSQQFQDPEFASLSGARVVRIATNPNYMSMGYGSRALKLLVDYYEGKFVSLAESEDADRISQPTINRVTEVAELNTNLLADDIHVRPVDKMPPLFSKLSEFRPEKLDYIGTSFGSTRQLNRFWSKAGFVPAYFRQTPNTTTGEHSCVMLRCLTNEKQWLSAFASDFRTRFINLLSYQFRLFPSIMALAIIEAATSGIKLDLENKAPFLNKAGLDGFFTPFDLKRLDSAASNLVDHHLIIDLIPSLATLYFTDRLGFKLGGIQQAILLSIGLQKKQIEEVSEDLNVPVSQALAMMVKLLRKFTTHFESLVAGAMEAEMPANSIGVSRKNASGVHDDELVDTRFAPLETTLQEELAEEGDEEPPEIKAQKRELINSLPLREFEIEGDDAAWEEAEKQVSKASKGDHVSSVVSVKSKKTKRKEPSAEIDVEEDRGEKRHKKLKKSKRDKRM